MLGSVWFRVRDIPSGIFHPRMVFGSERSGVKNIPLGNILYSCKRDDGDIPLGTSGFARVHEKGEEEEGSRDQRCGTMCEPDGQCAVAQGSLRVQGPHPVAQGGLRA